MYINLGSQSITSPWSVDHYRPGPIFHYRASWTIHKSQLAERILIGDHFISHLVMIRLISKFSIKNEELEDLNRHFRSNASRSSDYTIDL